VLPFYCIPVPSRNGYKNEKLPLVVASFCVIVLLFGVILSSPGDDCTWSGPVTVLQPSFLFIELPIENGRVKIYREARPAFLLLNACSIDRAPPV
jgi:hypothetical protein